MRVGFRTTLEKELLNEIKMDAQSKHLNVNDILEFLIEDYLKKEKNTSQHDFIYSLDEKEQIKFLTQKIMESIDECVYSYHYDYRGLPRNIIQDVIESVLLNSFCENVQKK